VFIPQDYEGFPAIEEEFISDAGPEIEFHIIAPHELFWCPVKFLGSTVDVAELGNPVGCTTRVISVILRHPGMIADLGGPHIATNNCGRISVLHVVMDGHAVDVVGHFIPEPVIRLVENAFLVE
jgi:hypothetical protein